MNLTPEQRSRIEKSQNRATWLTRFDCALFGFLCGNVLHIGIELATADKDMIVVGLYLLLFVVNGALAASVWQRTIRNIRVVYTDKNGNPIIK